MADISHSSARFVLTAKWSHHFCNSLCPSLASPAHVSQFQHSMDAAAPATTATTARRLAAAPEARCGQGPSAASKGTNAGAMEKRKVARRDPEKRRLQNLQAQKKYRESGGIASLHLASQLMSDLLQERSCASAWKTSRRWLRPSLSKVVRRQPECPRQRRWPSP